jgi:chromosome segregation ATPase
VNNYVGYPPHAPPTSSDNGSSQATAIHGSKEARPPGLTRGSSEDSGIAAELNSLQEIERLKNEVKQLRADKVEKERLKNETVQLKHLLEDERRKNREKDDKLTRLQKRVKDLECQDLMASKYQAATAQTRQNYAEEMQIKDDKIEELEDRLRILEEDNQRFQFIVEELKGKTKDAEDHIRYTRLQNHIAELEKSVKEMKARRKLVQEQLSKAEGDQ